MLCPDPRIPKDHQESNSYAKAKSLSSSPSRDAQDPPTQRDSTEGPELLKLSLFRAVTVRWVGGGLSTWQACDWLTMVSVGLSDLSIGSETAGVFPLMARV